MVNGEAMQPVSCFLLLTSNDQQRNNPSVQKNLYVHDTSSTTEARKRLESFTHNYFPNKYRLLYTINKYTTNVNEMDCL